MDDVEDGWGGFNIKRGMKGDLREMAEIRPNHRQNDKTLISLQPLNQILRSKGQSCSPFECVQDVHNAIGRRGKLIESERKREWGVLGEEEEDLEFVQDDASCGIAASSEGTTSLGRRWMEERPRRRGDPEQGGDKGQGGEWCFLELLSRHHCSS